MNRFVYSVILYLISPLLVLYLVFRGIKSPSYRQRWSERFGLKSLRRTDVLFHCVSMGETLAAVPLIKQLLAESPQLSVTITTTSPTGSNEVIKAFGDQVQHCYLPFDIPLCTQRFLTQVAPKMCVIMETELWPNLLHFSHKKAVKLVLANARLSAKSAAKYQQRPRLSIPMLQQLDCILAQDKQTAERFVALGVDSKKVSVTGSLKFDLSISDELKVNAKALRQIWRAEQRPVWVAGSVHPGEFTQMIAAHKTVMQRYPSALMIMVPRHPEQFNAAADAVVSNQLSLSRRSLQQTVDDGTQVLLGDTMGELLQFYGAADLAFVGGTLIDNGGHNPLEPAALGLPVFVGPQHWDFAEITQLLQQAGGLQVVQDSDGLAQSLIALLSQPETYRDASQASLAVVADNKGAVNKQLRHLIESLG
ncbi:lipid IV(A) 3-deoxy-D-manno-octulosonic acid transferase [Shewanella waksmanii]|uniref:lipid IV(A) 3-deoxy-D-manno-octulosonic acid transferase n=1 Tax=Shewanella waksmanii TaxID=213783 RepID=UPI0037364F2D